MGGVQVEEKGLPTINGRGKMFSVRQKKEIADKIQKLLKETNHPELPETEIKFHLHVKGAEKYSWADIKNNGACINPSVNPWNEGMDDTTVRRK